MAELQEDCWGDGDSWGSFESGALCSLYPADYPVQAVRWYSVWVIAMGFGCELDSCYVGTDVFV